MTEQDRQQRRAFLVLKQRLGTITPAEANELRQIPNWTVTSGGAVLIIDGPGLTPQQWAERIKVRNAESAAARSHSTDSDLG